jgi:thymidine kinase
VLRHAGLEGALRPVQRQLFSPVKRSPANKQVASCHSSPAKQCIQIDARAPAVHAPGTLHLVMGPMFAGKTTALLEMVAAAESANQRVAVITHAMDTRYGERQCVTHNGAACAALSVRTLMSLASPDGNDQGWDLDGFDVLAIDESQFFPDLKEFCLHCVEGRGKTVLAAGLSGDFKRNMFGDLVGLVPYADHADFLCARCTFCERGAAFTLRLVSNDQQSLVGGPEKYQPVCRHHYRSLSRVGEEFAP